MARGRVTINVPGPGAQAALAAGQMLDFALRGALRLWDRMDEADRQKASSHLAFLKQRMDVATTLGPDALAAFEGHTEGIRQELGVPDLTIPQPVTREIPAEVGMIPAGGQAPPVSAGPLAPGRTETLPPDYATAADPLLRLAAGRQAGRQAEAALAARLGEARIADLEGRGARTEAREARAERTEARLERGEERKEASAARAAEGEEFGRLMKLASAAGRRSPFTALRVMQTGKLPTEKELRDDIADFQAVTQKGESDFAKGKEARLAAKEAKSRPAFRKAWRKVAILGGASAAEADAEATAEWDARQNEGVEAFDRRISIEHIQARLRDVQGEKSAALTALRQIRQQRTKASPGSTEGRALAQAEQDHNDLIYGRPGGDGGLSGRLAGIMDELLALRSSAGGAPGAPAGRTVDQSTFLEMARDRMGGGGITTLEEAAAVLRAEGVRVR